MENKDANSNSPTRPDEIDGQMIYDKKSNKEANRKQEVNTKEFTKMLTTTSRNHYTLNQMVDRKARILLSMNALILSLIIGKIIVNKDILDLKFILLSVSGIAVLISIIYAMLAMMPEKTNANLTVEKIKNVVGNPLYYGNFINMSAETYENTMMEMTDHNDFVHRSLLQDIYQLGMLLEKKRRYLRKALYVLLIGILVAFIMAFLFRAVYGDALALR
ncbi:Pycsar system effector family protein [Aquimarina latercula]|uniref:Pycsar system effector family protein n=1 Tax=Aquimarina latercula TaxID=987 RepID=UPI00048012FE|nr:Pycsar system effector family protein [Aquimarina latercula]